MCNASINGSLVYYCCFGRPNYLLFEPLFTPIRDKNSQNWFQSLFLLSNQTCIYTKQLLFETYLVKLSAYAGSAPIYSTKLPFCHKLLYNL